ncbi:MAG: ricin-type beta-trefoil lectin domain protein [Pseudomonadota bacterium]
MKLEVIAFATVALVATASQSLAEQPNLQTPSPVIYLADNLDEVDQLGWCIDTLGRGFAERLQAHSCKPQGGDVQFSIDAQTGQIRSVEYPEYCMAHRPNDESTFALATCDATATDQQFVYDSEERTIRTNEDGTNCVSVGENSRSAGPFMSRTLLLTDCATTDEAFKEWVVLQ